MVKLPSAVWIVAIVLLAGCEGKTVETHDHVALAGAVDPSLTTEQQAQQQAMVDLLAAVQRGTAFEYLPEHVPHVRWEETADQFYAGAINLKRWNFVGAPQENQITLDLTFVLDQPGFPERADQRRYTVDRRGALFVIRRAAS